MRKRQQTLKWLLDFDWLLRSYDSPSYNATHCRIHYAHCRHLFPGHHGSKQLLCKFHPYKRVVCSMRSVSFSRAFPGHGYSCLFSMPNEEEESSTPTDQETRFSSLEAKLVALSSCFEALARSLTPVRAPDQLYHRIQTSKKIFCQQKTLTCSTQQKVSSVFRTKRLIFPTKTF